MTQHWAKAYPRKAFFIEMFTRDISLEDCILDLIDNSIDSLIRSRKIETEEIVLGSVNRTYREKHTVSVKFDGDSFEIKDNCGGISRQSAEEDVFNFGHSTGYESFVTGRRLGAYGIGMKRALFKIGRHFKISSKTRKDGFDMDVDLSSWVKRDEDPSDWRFPIEYASGAGTTAKAGTRILVDNLSKEIKAAFSDPTLEARLHRQVAQTYSEFLKGFVVVKINGKEVRSSPIPLGHSKDIAPSVEKLELGNVKVQVIASFATKGTRGSWETATAGWYVLCNGRVVVPADKTQLTGWGDGILPVYQPKFRGFIGVAMFESSDPLELPWTTTKRDLNRDAIIYRQVRKRMGVVAKPIIRMLEKFYGPDKEDTAEERDIAESMKQADLVAVAKGGPSEFRVSPSRVTKERETVRICVDAKKRDVARIRQHLRQPTMKNAEIGRHIFEYFLRSEGLR